MPTRTWRTHHHHILNKDRPELDDVDWLSSGQIVEDALDGRSQSLLLHVKLYTRAVAESRRVVDVGEVHGHAECFWKQVHVNTTSTEVWMCTLIAAHARSKCNTWAKTLPDAHCSSSQHTKLIKYGIAYTSMERDNVCVLECRYQCLANIRLKTFV